MTLFSLWVRRTGHVAVLGLLFSVLSLPATAQVARLTVQDRNGRPTTAVRVGDPFRVVVTVRPPTGAFPVFPEPPADPNPDSTALRFGEARVLALDRRPPRLEGEARTDSAVYTAAVFSLDSARVGPVEVRLVAGGDTAVVRAAPVLLEVAATTPDSAGLRPPGPPRDFPRAWGPPFLTALGVLVVLGLVVLGVRAWRRRPRRLHMPAMGHLPPYEQALARLDALARVPVDTDAAAEAHHVELADLIRTYLERTLRFDTHRLTTNDLDAHLDGEARVPDAARTALVGVLREADLVKFARRRPTPDALAAARDRTRAALEVVQAAQAAEAPSGPTADGGPQTAEKAGDDGPRPPDDTPRVATP